jgi:hypothetical protein
MQPHVDDRLLPWRGVLIRVQRSLHLPFDGAADGVGDGIFDFLVREYGFDGVAKIMKPAFIRILPVVVNAADISATSLREFTTKTSGVYSAP